MGNALAEHRRSYLGAVLRHRFPGLSGKRPLDWDRIQHNARRDPCNPADVQARLDCMEVGHRGAARNQGQVGATCCSKRGIR